MIPPAPRHPFAGPGAPRADPDSAVLAPATVPVAANEGKWARPDVRSSRRLLIASLLAVSVVAVVPHVPALAAGWTYDDREFVIHNASIRRLSTALGAFLSPFPPEQPERGLFRPVTNLSYALDHLVFGDWPGGFHGTNIAIYWVLCLLSLLVARRLLPGPHALAAALVFAAHPVHCEAVDSVAGRSELLSLSFGLLALLCARRHDGTGRPGWFAAMVACLASAMLAKESGVMAVVVVGAYLVLVRHSARMRLIGGALGALVISYVALRLSVLGRVAPELTVGGKTLSTRVATAAAVYVENLRLLFFPSLLDVDYFYQHALERTEPTRTIIGVTLILATLGLTAWLVAQAQSRPRRAVAAFAAVMFVACLLPTSHVVPFGAVLAERFLLAPSAALALLLLAFVPRISAPYTIVFLALTVLLGGRTYARARDWRDSVTLFSQTAGRVSPDPRIETNLAYGYIERGDAKTAIVHLRRALAIDPSHLAALNNLGYLLMHSGSYEQARAVFARIIEIDPANASAFNNLGVIATQTNDYPLARARYRKALAINPNHQSARENLSSVEAALERAAAYVRAHQDTIERSNDASEWLTFARACHALGNLACARTSYARGKQIEPMLREDPVLEAIAPTVEERAAPSAGSSVQPSRPAP